MAKLLIRKINQNQNGNENANENNYMNLLKIENLMIIDI